MGTDRRRRQVPEKATSLMLSLAGSRKLLIDQAVVSDRSSALYETRHTVEFCPEARRQDMDDLNAELNRWTLSSHDFEEAHDHLQTFDAIMDGIVQRAHLRAAIVAFGRPFKRSSTIPKPQNSYGSSLGVWGTPWFIRARAGNIRRDYAYFG